MSSSRRRCLTLALALACALRLVALAPAVEAAEQDRSYIIETRPALPGARVSVDGVEIGVTDDQGRLLTSPMSPGRHQVRVTADGVERFLSRIEFPGNRNVVTVPIRPALPTMADEPPASAAQPDPPAATDEPEGSSGGVPVWAYALLFLAIAGLGLGLFVVLRRSRGEIPPIPTAASLDRITTTVSPVDSGTDGPPPDVGSEYRIVGLISRGGQGEVYLAETGNGANHFAVKVPRLAPEAGPEALRAFLREAEESRRLLNGHIITVFKAGVEAQPPGRPYYIMEYFESISLRGYLRQFGRLTEAAALGSVVLPVVEALQYAHSKTPPIIHRDLKPENVLVKCDAGGNIQQVKVIDFGLSFGDQKGLQGTPPYVAPEVLEGSEAGTAADLFSLGVLFVELLQGRPPFYDRQIHEMKRRILEESFDRRNLSPQILPLLDRLLAKNADQRFSSAEELLMDGREILFSLRKTVET